MCMHLYDHTEKQKIAICQAVEFSHLLSRTVCFKILNVRNEHFTLSIYLFIHLSTFNLLFCHFELKELKKCLFSSYSQ